MIEAAKVRKADEQKREELRGLVKNGPADSAALLELDWSLVERLFADEPETLTSLRQAAETAKSAGVDEKEKEALIRLTDPNLEALAPQFDEELLAVDLDDMEKVKNQISDEQLMQLILNIGHAKGRKDQAAEKERLEAEKAAEKERLEAEKTALLALPLEQVDLQRAEELLKDEPETLQELRDKIFQAQIASAEVLVGFLTLQVVMLDAQSFF